MRNTKPATSRRKCPARDVAVMRAKLSRRRAAVLGWPRLMESFRNAESASGKSAARRSRARESAPSRRRRRRRRRRAPGRDAAWGREREREVGGRRSHRGAPECREQTMILLNRRGYAARAGIPAVPALRVYLPGVPVYFLQRHADLYHRGIDKLLAAATAVLPSHWPRLQGEPECRADPSCVDGWWVVGGWMEWGRG